MQSVENMSKLKPSLLTRAYWGAMHVVGWIIVIVVCFIAFKALLLTLDWVMSSPS